MITDGTLAALGCAPRWRAILNDACALYGIDTEQRETFFLAAALYETAGLTRLEVDLNGGPQTLLDTWPRSFTPAEAVAMAHDPERVADRAYAGYHGNGDEGSGDGWRYRPRGLLMLTGRTQYKACGAGIGVDLLAHPDLIGGEPSFAALSGAWLWASTGCNEIADTGNFVTCVRRLTGGVDGQAGRSEWLVRVKAVMRGDHG